MALPFPDESRSRPDRLHYPDRSLDSNVIDECFPLRALLSVDSSLGSLLGKRV